MCLICSRSISLFIKNVATKDNVAICFEKESFTYSEPKKTFKDWFIQKRRHISTSNYYKPIHQFLLGLFYVTQIAFWTLSAVLLSFTFQWEIVLMLFSVRMLIQWLTIGKSSKKLDTNDVILWVPFLEIFLILFQLVIFSANLISKPKHWK